MSQKIDEALQTALALVLSTMSGGPKKIKGKRSTLSEKEREERRKKKKTQRQARKKGRK